jgi:hypothetical protein
MGESPTMFPLFRSRRSASSPVVDAALLEALAAADEMAAADADAALTPDRAAAQRAAILARLGAEDDRRVLAFPPREAADPRPHAPRPALGWMLTAAAAGLVVGVGTGRGIGLELPGTTAQAPASRVVAIAPPPAAAAPTAESDDAIFDEVEVALAGGGVEELQPLDALTPRVTLVASR